MRDLSTTLCRGITRQVLATVPLRARPNGHPVVAGLHMLTDDLVPVAGGPSEVPRAPGPFTPRPTPTLTPDRGIFPPPLSNPTPSLLLQPDAPVS